jgi:micrococcal nuclease
VLLAASGGLAAAVVLAALLAWAAAASAQDAANALPPGGVTAPTLDARGREAYLVTRVVDGDTIRVQLADGSDVAVRIIGVDTPETKDPRKPVERFGKEAADYTTQLLQGQYVYLEADQGAALGRDRYGRVLAHVWRAQDMLLVALSIIEQGYGHYYGKYPFRQAYMDLYRQAEQEARASECGLWADDRPAAKRNKSQVVAPESRVTVMVTLTGKKYHRAGCRHLGKSKAAISLLEAKRRGYKPCKDCQPPE